jgi:glycosyltransferase involved in cell wall biosynthesis
MKLAPVAIFTFNRPDHTKSMLSALAANNLAAQSDVVIFSDGPRSPSDDENIALVRSLAHEARGFRTLRVVERQQNMGLARSVIAGVSELLKASDRIIVLEDDLLTSRHFLSFMNEALEHYRGDPNAFSVTGHSFSNEFLRIPGDYRYDTYAGLRCSSWSWGTWVDRWRMVDWDMTYYSAFCRDTALQEEFNRGGRDMATLLHLQRRGEINSWAIRFCYAHTANKMQCIYPTRTLVRNIGLDNSGTHSRPEPRFQHRGLDDTWMPRRWCPADFVDPQIAASFQALFDPPAANTGWNLLRRMRNSVSPVYRLARRLIGAMRRRVFRSKKPAEILVVNTYERTGGAARAAQRLFLGIRGRYPEVQYLTLLRDSDEPAVHGHRWNSIGGAVAQSLARLDQLPLLRYGDRSRAIFSPARYPNPLRIRLSQFSPQLVHLHWIAGGLVSIEELSALRAPIVWTLHDTWAFTGGCHYTGPCERYSGQCGACPQLQSGKEGDISQRILRRKSRAFSALNITVVAPSRWLAEKALRSSLFKDRRIEVIPNGLDTDAFKPIPKEVARNYLSLDSDRMVLLFAAETLTDPRKGGDLLVRALGQLGSPCTLLTFGGGGGLCDVGPNVEVRSLGRLTDTASLAMAYSAADAFICPSREDNLPNTVAEALSCGTPCVAFNVNGLPDMIEHQSNGWLAKPFDPADLAKGIRWIGAQSHQNELRTAARAKALSNYSIEVMTERYCSLYAELLGQAPMHKQEVPVPLAVNRIIAAAK